MYEKRSINKEIIGMSNMEENVISESKNIVNLFQTLKANKTDIFLRHELKEYNATVSNVSDVSVILNYKGNISAKIEKLEFNSTQGDTVYFCIMRIIKVTPDEITLSLPMEIEKRIKRKYKRVNTEGDVFLHFNIITNFDDKGIFEDNKKIPPQFSAIYKEITNELPDVKRIVPLLSQELKKKAPLFEIKLHKGGETYPKRVELLKKFKETVFISNAKDSKNYIKDIHNMGAITFLPFIHEIKQKVDDDAVVRKILVDIMREDLSTTATSYICSPIMLFGNVIGHIFLGATDGSHVMFRDQDIYFVQTACQLLSEAFAKNRLYQLNTGEDYSIATVDLSGGGLSMKIVDPVVLKYLYDGTKLRIMTKVMDKEIKTVGKVTRIEKESDSVGIIGVKFTEIKWNDQEYIDKYVLRKIEMDKMQKKDE